MADEKPSPARPRKQGLVSLGGDYYHLMFEHAGVSMVATDAAFEIRSCNLAACRMFGTAAGSMLGTSLPAVIPQEGRDDAGRALQGAVHDGIMSQFEFVHRDENGETRQLAVTVSPIPDCSGRRIGALACFRDITNRMRMTERLAEQRKMVSLGEMAGALAHHFNNILGGIVTSVDFALATSDPDVRQRVLQKTAQALTRATRLVDSLLAFAEGDRRHEDTGDLTETMVRLVDRIEPELKEHGIELEFEVDPIPMMSVYRKQIDTVLLHLIENAVQAMPGGGRLRISLAQAGKHVEIQVVDSGCGMTREELTRIFEPFYSGAHTESGARLHGEGLGLAVVHGIVQDLGATISVTSEPGRGTTFRILMPPGAPKTTG